MSDTTQFEIPEFLRRTPSKPGEPMTAAPATPAPKPTRTRRTDAYVARITIAIPLDMNNADSLAGAIKTVAAIEATLPPGATFKSEGSLGKI